jgi:TonB family protein
MMNISIPMSDFAPNRLVCLAQTLKERYGEQRGIEVLIFSTRAAAMHYTMPLSGDSVKPRVNWAARMYATYFFHPDKHEEYLYLTPDPMRPSIDSPLVTRIDLPVTNLPACPLRINGRCLVALEDIEYPNEALKAKMSGTVTLTGIVSREGKITHIQVAEANSSPAEGKDLLVREAANNLSTWHLEEARQVESVRITYSFVIDSSLPRRGQVDVQLALPNQVTIRGNPIG